MRCAPVVSLHSQPPVLDSSSNKHRLRIRQRSPRHLPRSTITTQRITSASIAPIKSPTPPKPSLTSHTPSLAAISQSRAPCLTQTNTTTQIRRPHTPTTPLSPSARRKQAPPRYRRYRHGDESRSLGDSQASSPRPLRTASRPCSYRLLLSTLSSCHSISSLPGSSNGLPIRLTHQPRRPSAFHRGD
jgi:hypothetical protein